MYEKPKFMINILAILWLLMSLMFIIWGIYSLDLVLEIPSWPTTSLSALYPLLFFGYLLSMIVWFVFACLFVVFSYGTLKSKGWVWTSGIIISTIFILVFGLMLASFMATAILFLDYFSVAGLVSVVITLLIDLGIVYFLTRPDVEKYFAKNE